MFRRLSDTNLYECTVCGNAGVNKVRTSSYDRTPYKSDYENNSSGSYVCSDCHRHISRNKSRKPRSQILMSTDLIDKPSSIYSTCHETNLEVSRPPKYTGRSHLKATFPLLAEHSDHSRTMSWVELTTSTDRHTLYPKNVILEQSISIDHRCTQSEENNQQLTQQVNSLYRVFNILEDRNQELKTQMNDLMAKNQQLQQQANNTDERCNQLEATDQNLTTQMTDLTASIDQLQQQANNTDQRCNQLEVVNQSLSTQVTDLKRKNQQLQQQANNTDARCNQLEATNQNLTTQVTDLIANTEQLQQQANNTDQRCNQLEALNQCLSAQTTDLSVECKLLKADKETLNMQICDLNQQLQNHREQLTAIWIKMNAHPDELIYQPREENDTLEEHIEFSEEPIPVEEDAYYDKCKQYYQITKMPLMSISDDVLDNDIESTSTSLVVVVDEDYNNFDAKIFLNHISSILKIRDISIKNIQKGCVKVIFEIFKKVASKVKKIEVKAVYDYVTDRVLQQLGELKILFMFMGNIDALNEKQKFRNDIKLFPQWNRIYDRNHLYWAGPLDDGKDRGNQPYYCPTGWQRYSFHVTDHFYEKFKGWCVCYHGTKFSYGLPILLSGLAPARAGNHGAGIYATPSIIYAAHPRYSEVKEIESVHERSFFKEGRYVQFVLQCRVHPANIKKIGRETLAVNGKATIDPKITNDDIEWVIDSKEKQLMDFNDPNSTIVCTGLMLRVTDTHPGLLLDSDWWFKSHLCPKKGNSHCLLGIDLDELTGKKNEGAPCNILYP